MTFTSTVSRHMKTPARINRPSKTLLAACTLAAVQTMFLGTAIAGLTVPNDGSDAKLSDTHATAQTNATYALIKGRTVQRNSNMIEGQHMGGPGDLGTGSAVFDINSYRIDSQTPGRHAYPRMVGARYDANVDDASGHPVYTLDSKLIQKMNAYLIDVSSQYHPIISITATPRNPWDQAAGRSPSAADRSLDELYYAHRGEHNSAAEKFWNEIDVIADGLAQLKMPDGSSIPVVFRPFAEVNTDKYYFRGQNSAYFVELWKQVADYYVVTRNLHNLIFSWEAWVWNRNPSAAPSEVNIAPWYPVASARNPIPYVDIVAGSFYFTSAMTDYFKLAMPAGSSDRTVFYSLMNLAVANDKPFGATQWAVNFKSDLGGNCVPGDNQNTLTFMSNVDAQHYAATVPVQHMAFAYYWGDNKMCLPVNKQANARAFVDDPRVASISGLDYINSEGGWIRESNTKPGKGGALSAGLPLRTGDSAGNRQYKSIISFDTSAATLPANAVLSADPATLILTRSGAAGLSPFRQGQGLGLLSIDAASKYFGTDQSFRVDDFEAGAGDQLRVGPMGDPASSTTGATSYGALATHYLNRQGHTQLRIGFARATDGGNTDNYIDWNGATGTVPELIMSYTLPNP